MNAWVETAERQNWSIIAAQYASRAAMENIKQQAAGHYPTVSLQGSYNVAYSNTVGNSAVNSLESNTPPTAINGTLLPGTSHSTDATLSLNLGIPIFQGGQVVAETNQAKYNYQLTTQQLEQSVRTTINNTRQSYLGIILGIKQIQADREAIKSTMSSYQGLFEGYRVGTQTLVDVLNQQQKVFLAETQYSADRYAYVNNLLKLKQAAGTLSVDDLVAIDAWLTNDNEALAETENDNFDTPRKHAKKIHHHAQSKMTPSLPTQPIAMARADAINAQLSRHLTKTPDLSLSP